MSNIKLLNNMHHRQLRQSNNLTKVSTGSQSNPSQQPWKKSQKNPSQVTITNQWKQINPCWSNTVSGNPEASATSSSITRRDSWWFRIWWTGLLRHNTLRSWALSMTTTGSGCRSFPTPATRWTSECDLIEQSGWWRNFCDVIGWWRNCYWANQMMMKICLKM